MRYWNSGQMTEWTVGGENLIVRKNGKYVIYIIYREGTLIKIVNAIRWTLKNFYFIKSYHTYSSLTRNVKEECWLNNTTKIIIFKLTVYSLCSNSKSINFAAKKKKTKKRFLTNTSTYVRIKLIYFSFWWNYASGEVKIKKGNRTIRQE